MTEDPNNVILTPLVRIKSGKNMSYVIIQASFVFPFLHFFSYTRKNKGVP